MNANLPPQTLVIKDWLESANNKLSKIGILSARLDSEIILSHALGKNRTYLHAHGDESFNSNTLNNANTLLEMRLERVPVAYIVGYKYFYGRKFLVSTDTLIPRPESEDIITILKQLILPNANNLQQTKLIDVGTGSGCLGITAKLEFPQLNVTLSDISEHALKIAKQNANILSTKVSIINSDLLSDYQEKVDIIIANLPYVNEVWDRSPETEYEPSTALFANDNGLSFINRLIIEAGNVLSVNGLLILEADPTQHNSIVNYAKKYSFILINKIGYVLAFRLDNLIDAVKE